MAADLREFLIDHHLENPILGGSLDGWQNRDAVRDALSGHIEKLVVVDIAPKFYPIHHAELIRGLKAIDLAMLKGRTEAEHRFNKQYEPIPAVRQFLLKNLYRNEQGASAGG